MKRLVLLLVLAALALPSGASAGRFAVGLEPGASPERVAAAVEARSGGTAAQLAPFALVLRAPSSARVAGVPGVAYVERLDRPWRRLAFTPNDPLIGRQWYLQQIQAFDAWPLRPSLLPVTVAVIDSGIDGDHPDLEGKIAAARSFVGGSARKDTQGHGTFVAGLIAAETGNAEGIAGIGLSAELLVAKVVRPDGSISLEAEARAIRWAVREGAQIINLSFGGVRDPQNPRRDTFSPLEASAIEFAVRHGVLVVAAVGNGDQAPSMPWTYASYPAALPHVVGVGAVARDGTVPSFSNRDPVYVDVTAPGQDIFSTLPRSLTGAKSGCTPQGYSECGPLEFRRAEGTSFAAPQVTAAAALLLGLRPGLRAEQAAAALTRSAVDAAAETGCRRCLTGRDSLTGWGRLDVAAAVDSIRDTLSPVDRFEPNDDGGGKARTLRGKAWRIRASVDFWDDQLDVYRVYLRRGQRVRAAVQGRAGTDTNLILWKPGARRLETFGTQHLRAAQSARPGASERIRYRVRASGWYYVEVKISQPGSGAYSLRLAKR